MIINFHPKKHKKVLFCADTKNGKRFRWGTTNPDSVPVCYWNLSNKKVYLIDKQNKYQLIYKSN